MTLNPIVARREFHHAPWRRTLESIVETRHFEDAITELQQIRRAILLGDPGAGKTTTLFKLAADLIDIALLEKQAPVPLLIRFSYWTAENEPLLIFLQRHLGNMGGSLRTRLQEKQVVLLLDGLNEIPANQQEAKYRQVKQFLTDYPTLMVIITCRQQDYPPDRDLNLDKITVAPLDPVRIREFIDKYLGKENGADLFWQLSGEETRNQYRAFVQKAKNKLAQPFDTFWLARTLPKEVEWGYSWQWPKWLKQRAHPANMLHLATNPYMLFMLLDVYRATL